MDRLSYLAHKQLEAALPKKKSVKWLVKVGSVVYYENESRGLCGHYKKLHNLISAVIKAVY